MRLIEATAGKYALHQNRPNPFNPATEIGFSLGLDSRVLLRVYIARGGAEIVRLVDEYLPVGEYSVQFDASPLPSGMYNYRLEAGGYTETRRMSVVK